jgi:hypothetical protein
MPQCCHARLERTVIEAECDVERSTQFYATVFGRWTAQVSVGYSLRTNGHILLRIDGYLLLRQ